MKSTQKTIVWLGVLAIAVMLPIAAGARDDFEDSIKKSFRVAEGGRLTVESDLGSIEVKAVSGSTVEVEIIRTVRAHSEKEVDRVLEDLHIDFDHTGNNVTIITKYERGKLGLFDWDHRNLRLRYIISVPLKYNVDLKTAGGSISVDDLEGEVYSKTSGGSISLEGCTGMADVATSGGSINLGEVNGKVDARTSGGSISIDRAQGDVVAKTSGGSINVEEVLGSIDASTSGGTVTAHISKQPAADCRLSTSGGSVVAYLADGIGVDLDAHTSGGRVRTDFPVTVQGEISKSNLQAKVNGGGPLLYLRASGGNISISKM